MSDTETTVQLQGMPALEDAFLHYRELGLRIPPVPHGLVDALTEDAPGRYSTTAMNLEDAGDLVRLAATAVPDQVGFGQLGHGVSSWFYCCRVITPALAAYVRVSYGSVYVDDGSDADAVNAALMGLEELIVTAKDAAGAGRIPGGGRLVVVLDVLGPSFWQVGAEQRHETADPLNDAQDWLSVAA